ncbi:hypothetical protein QR685DRAFT_333476 [Neurospora intermedia]|uniref:Uncharacterized protein n=1 Tax=Neurospora intermedia TaxID=5142 RepID=A0ABR3D7D8_NEUIN
MTVTACSTTTTSCTTITRTTTKGISTCMSTSGTVPAGDQFSSSMTSLPSMPSVSSPATQPSGPTGTANAAPQQPPSYTSSSSPSSIISLLSSTVVIFLSSSVPRESGGSVPSTLPNLTSTVTEPEITVTIPETTMTVPSTAAASEHCSFPPARSILTIIPTPLCGTDASPIPNGPSGLPTSETSVTTSSSSSSVTVPFTSPLPFETYSFSSRVGRPFSG